jgi:hypothetical protein
MIGAVTHPVQKIKRLLQKFPSVYPFNMVSFFVPLICRKLAP